MRRAVATFVAMSLMITAYLLAGGLGTALGASHSQCNRIGSPNCVASTTTTSTNTASTSTTTATVTTTETSTSVETEFDHTNVTSTETTTSTDTRLVVVTGTTTTTVSFTTTESWWSCTEYFGTFTFTWTAPDFFNDPYSCQEED